MKNLIRRTLGAIVSLTMLTGVLSGCAGASYDPVQEVMGYKGSTVLLTVNGNQVTAMDYFFWLAQGADQMASYYSAVGGEVDWTAPMGESDSTDVYVKEQAKANAVVYSLIASKAKASGYEFTKEDQAAYDQELAKAKEQMGSEDAYNNNLKGMCVNPEGFLKLSTVGVLYDHMLNGMYQSGGSQAPTDAVLTQYVKDNDLLCAKHILLMTKDAATGNTLSDAQKAEKKTKAEGLLKQLQAATDPATLEAKFDELMKANSEDTGLSTNPDGYVFTADQMVKEFEDATRALKPGQLSGLVESDYGYHIILRQDPLKSAGLKARWANEQMNQQLAQWEAEAEVVTTETYDSLSAADFYEKLTAYRETLKSNTQPTENGAGKENGDAGEPAEGNGQTDAKTDAKDDAKGGTDQSNEKTGGQTEGGETQPADKTPTE